MEFKLINHKDRKMAEEIMELQRASYQKEAELIGTRQIPPLLETVKDIRQINAEKVLGVIKEGKLIAMLAYEMAEEETTIISRLAVHPKVFRQGLAKKLFHKLLQITDSNVYLVTTGKANIPAITFYQKMGFTLTEEWITKENIPLVLLKRYTN